MHPAVLSLYLALSALAFPPTVLAQLRIDTVFTWRDYARMSTTHLQIYDVPANEDRPHTVVLRELAENAGGSTVNDARHLVELIGRQYDLDPSEATWIFHWGSFSFKGAEAHKRKELFLRATFRWNKSGTLGTPLWRVVSREQVEAYTDRQFH